MRSSHTRPFPTPRGRARPAARTARLSGMQSDQRRVGAAGAGTRGRIPAPRRGRHRRRGGPREHAVGLGHRGDRLRKRRLPFAARHVVPRGRHGARIIARPATTSITPWCRTAYRSSCTRRPWSASRPPPIPGGTCEPPRPSGPISQAFRPKRRGTSWRTGSCISCGRSTCPTDLRRSATPRPTSPRSSRGPCRSTASRSSRRVRPAKELAELFRESLRLW